MHARSLTVHEVKLMRQKDATLLGDFPALSNGMIEAIQMRRHWAREKGELNMDSSSWRAKGPSDLRNEDRILSGADASLPFNFFMADSNSPIWGGPQVSSSRWCVETFLELFDVVSISLWHIKFADPGAVIYEYIGLGFDVGDGSTFVGHHFVWRVGIRRTG